MLRNGSYKLNVTLDGLTGKDMTLSIAIANWEALSTQNVNVGK